MKKPNITECRRPKTAKISSRKFVRGGCVVVVVVAVVVV